jgi:AcrR family transcriptional regulator
MGNSEITRDALLEAALHEASLSGIARLTLAPVAAAAGRSKGGLLRHFPNKESLQIAVLDYAFSHFRHYVLEPALPVPSGLPRLRAIMENWLNWTERAGLPGGCPILGSQHDFHDQDSAVSLHVRESWATWQNYLRRQADKAQQASQLPPGLEPDALAMLMLGLKAGAQMEWRLLKDRDANRRALLLFDHVTGRN